MSDSNDIFLKLYPFLFPLVPKNILPLSLHFGYSSFLSKGAPPKKSIKIASSLPKVHTCRQHKKQITSLSNNPVPCLLNKKPMQKLIIEDKL